MKEITITLNEKEQFLLSTVLGIGIYNGNHITPKAFVPDPEEYKMLCRLFNKVREA